jgi:hypothetical protein
MMQGEKYRDRSGGVKVQMMKFDEFGAVLPNVLWEDGST